MSEESVLLGQRYAWKGKAQVVLEQLDSELPPNSISQQFSNEFAASNGEIYRQLRECQLNGRSEDKWLARLSKSIRKDIRQLHRKEEALTKALDDLLPFCGLWLTVELGTLHRILTLRCPKELVRYVKKVRKIWLYIMLDDETLVSQIDPLTVDLLECLNPGLSYADWSRIRWLMSTGRIFPSITDNSTRGQMLERLRTLKEPILSLRTFIQDTIYLEVITKPLRRLASTAKGALVDVFRSMYQGSGELLVQCSDEEDDLAIEVYQQDIVYIHYLELVLCCMRHFEALTGVSPRVERGKLRENYQSDNPVFEQVHLAKLAQRRGFRSPAISESLHTTPEQAATMAFLLEVRQPNDYNYPEHQRSELVAHIESTLEQVTHRVRRGSRPIFTTDFLPLEKCQRMGRPRAMGYHIDRKHTFIREFYDLFDPTPAEHMTTLAVKRFFFVAFFGELEVRQLHGNNNASTPREATLQANQPRPSTQVRNDDFNPSDEHNEGYVLENHEPPNDSPVRQQNEIVNERELENPLPDPLIPFLQQEYRASIQVLVIFLISVNRRYVRLSEPESRALAGILMSYANQRFAFATMTAEDRIERHDINSIQQALRRDHVLFVYERRTSGVYPFNDLEGFLSST